MGSPLDWGPSPLPAGDTAALFDGVTGRITVPNSDELNPTRITMEALVRWDGDTGLQQRIVEKESWVGIPQYSLSVREDGRAHVEDSEESGSASGSSFDARRQQGDPVAFGAETHVAATYDGQAIAIYLDGSLNSTTVVNASPVDIDVKPPVPGTVDPAIEFAIGDRIGVSGGRQRTSTDLSMRWRCTMVRFLPTEFGAHYEAQAAMAPTTRIQVSATDNSLHPCRGR